MSFTARKLWTLALVGVYGGISLLGHGLHSLAPMQGHHHGLQVVCAPAAAQEQPRCCGHQHKADQHAENDGERTDDSRLPRLASADGCGHSHLCGICAFLLKARSDKTPAATTVVWQHAVAAAAIPEQRTYSATTLGPHAARGPPQQLA